MRYIIGNYRPAFEELLQDINDEMDEYAEEFYETKKSKNDELER